MPELTPERRERKRQSDRQYTAAHREEARLRAQAWREANRERHRAYSRDYFAEHRADTNAKRVVRRANDLERERSTGRAYRAVHVIESRERTAAWYSAHPDRMREYVHRRRVRKRGVVLVIRIASDICGVCLDPLYPDLRHGHPLATTVGHEPPLSVASRDGWLVVTERPEHAACNKRKKVRLDCELTVHNRMSPIQETIASAPTWAAPDRRA